MAVDSKEVSKFTSGLIGSSSETDLGSDFATFSTNVDSEFEKGALRGIKGDLILSKNGWELPRYSKWRIRMQGVSVWDEKAFLLQAYNKKFLVVFTDSTVPAELTTLATAKNWEVLQITLSASNITVNLVIDALVEGINSLKTNYALSLTSGISHYFSSVKTVDSENRFYIVISSNFLGDIPAPSSPDELKVFSDESFNDYRTHNAAVTTAYMLFPDKEKFSEVETPTDWEDEYDGFFVKGNGFLPASENSIPLNFSFLKPLNQKGNSNLFGITSEAKAILLENLGTSDLNRINLGDVTISNSIFNVTAQQRNSNLYIGTGATKSTKSLWFGKLDRKQLNVVYEDEYKLLPNSIEPLNSHHGPISMDNIVVPTLHYGLNSSNGGIAGSANIYCDSSGNDTANSTLTSQKIRTVNNWATKCLQNNGVTVNNNNVFKLGMIFRLDLNGAFVASKKVLTTYNGTDETGVKSFEFLQSLKSFAKGNIVNPYDSGADSTTLSSTLGGSDGEALHSGDLFQIVFVPSTDAAPDQDALETSAELIRFAYVGHLTGDTLEGTNGSGDVSADNLSVNSHDSKTCYSGTPAYSFGHVNDSSKLYRIKNTSKNQDYIQSLDFYDTIYNSNGNVIDATKELLENVNLGEELGVEGFKIGTISECKSADGTGGFGGGNPLINVAITSITADSSISTFTIGAHDLIIGDKVVISGSHADYNDTHTVTVVANTTFTISSSSTETGTTGTPLVNAHVNKNYYAGYGKLWISNINEYNKLYLVDISNWDIINADLNRITSTEVTLNFDRIHDQLHATDNTSFGKGLIRLWYQDFGTDDAENLIGNYSWKNEPQNQYISSICETYSHKSHLGDGALGGANVGDGKWRVWVNYNKVNDTAHLRWDLFLFNFRPQAINPTTTQDVQVDLNNGTNNEVYMYDKTPPYQECAEITLGNSENSWLGENKVCYPYDKFSFSKVFNSHPPANTYENLNTGSHRNAGGEWLGITGGANRRNHFVHYDDSQAIINWRNPSGEFMTWKVFYGSTYGDGNSPVWNVSLGNNIGWLSKEEGYRAWVNNRHCMKPHFKEWYFTGVTGNKTASELGSPVAHIVSFIGKLSGSFIKSGGVIKADASRAGGFNFGKTVSWYSSKERELEVYNDDLVLYSMHDSPVAFSTTTGSGVTKTAVFSSGEIQGAPNNDKDNVTTGTGVNSEFNDTEAGFLIDKSVPATIGHSRFNQYRHGHDHNGTLELNKDNDYTGESFDEDDTTKLRHGYINTRHYTSSNGARGCSYNGADGFGHYNMISTTWASNSEILLDTRGMNRQMRVFGYGFNKFKSFARDISKSNSGEASFSGTLHERNGYTPSSATAETLARIKMGTGYLTYQWPYDETPVDNDITNDSGNYADSKAGYYHKTDGITIPKAGKDPSGTDWENRKTVFCWSTTCVTDSLFKNTDTTLGLSDATNQYDTLISPRCSFRKIELPSGYRFNDINNIDFISWQRVNQDASSTRKHGYIISGKAADSPINDIDTSSTIMCVIDNKSINSYKRSSETEEGQNKSNLIWKDSQSKAAISNIIPLLKQHLQKKHLYFNQISSYTNDNMVFKNLNPGLSDSPILYNTTDHWKRKFHKNNLTGTDTNTISSNIMLDTYSPIILGNTGGNDIEGLSNWMRPQFTITDSNLSSMGDFPYYRHDRLWNFWSVDERSPNNDLDELDDYNIEAGFDNAVLKEGTTIKNNKRLTEGFGSTAGTTMFDGQEDKKYPAYYDDTDNILTIPGSHFKLFKDQLLIKDSEEAADVDIATGENIGVVFHKDKIVYYQFSFIYDGFQESPLNGVSFPITSTIDAKYLRMKLSLPSVEQFNLNPRVTHINLYRKNNINNLFRLVKSINLNGDKNKFQNVGNRYIYKFNDERTSTTYEGLNGVSETLDNFTPNYALSAQLNDFLFIANVQHDKLDEGGHILLRSKKGKYSIFDWSNDYLDLPTKPTAIVSFANRIFLFDDNNTYIVNPEGLYIEDKTEGIGILNSQSFVVTDIGMFFCDRNNIYIHNGKSATPIGGPILYNHSRPEWQIGYLDAIHKAETLGYTPKVAFDSTKQCLYIVLQGFNDADTQNFNTSYRTNDSRLYSFNIQSKRWDYYECPNVKAIATANKGDVVISDGYQVYNYRVDKRNKKDFVWESKEFVMGSSNYNKVFKRLYITGEMCLWNFNNSTVDGYIPIASPQDNTDWGGGFSYDEQVNYTAEDDTHLLETGPASETDDLKVYIDGVLQTMRVQDRKPHIGHFLANDKTNSIYTVETHLPAFESDSNNLTDYDGNALLNCFTLNKFSLPEFIDPPHSQYTTKTKQGEISELTHIHKGQYLYFSGKDSDGVELEEIVKVRSIFFGWTQDESGINDLSEINPVKITCFRGLLGTKAIDWNKTFIAGGTINQIRIATPILKFPTGSKGKNVKIVFKNQKSYIDSFAITFRKKRFK